MYKVLLQKIFPFGLSKKQRIIVNHTFGRSFKFGKSDAVLKILVLRAFYQLLKKPLVYLAPVSSSSIIIDLNKNAFPSRLKFIQYFKNLEEPAFVDLEDYSCFQNNWQKARFIIQYSPLVGLAFITSLFFKDKTSFAELASHALIKQNLKKTLAPNINYTIYHFCIYALSSNYLAAFFLSKNYRLIKFLSMAPLSLWNKNILTDQLILTTGYQKEELKYHEQSIMYSSHKIWGPERLYEYAPFYKDSNINPCSNKIGFYSTASWIRSKLNHIDQGIDMVKAEEIVLQVLGKVIAERPELELILFLHPKEKNRPLLEIETHYTCLLGNVPFTFYDFETPSHLTFNEVELAVAFNTSLIHERLYMGFKSLLFPMNPLFPISGTAMESICAKTNLQLEEKIIENLSLTNDRFFAKNNLEQYVFLKNFQKPQELE